MKVRMMVLALALTVVAVWSVESQTSGSSDGLTVEIHAALTW